MDVKGVIKEKGWTIEKVAAEMKNRDGTRGVSPVTLHQNLSRNPTINTLQKIAYVIGCNVGEFFKDELEQPNDPNTITCPHCGKKIVFTKQEESK
jgi:transcriptional regulator with XRE-family HTH domain